ncbi:hypothetical protein RRF57_008101 [Xylaria bambusicola]|uniref:Uncharacterized protein n=1 Tax=Xylaria bambusicola TaxID=326684 RepID=A0AAN7Z6S8_9PEZI
MPFPPPPPLPPCLRASFRIHSSRNSRSANFLPSVTFVWTIASPASKLNKVGTLVIMYVIPSVSPLPSPLMISGASYSTVQNATPPSCSPTPDSTSDLISGATARHVPHQDVVHSVSSGVRAEDERSW